MINIKIIEKRYGTGGKPVLEDLEFTVQRGEFVAVIGPSGSGKSTLLQLVSGLDSDFSGEIDMSDIDGRAPEIGYMFQDSRLMPWLTALENVCLVAGGRRGRGVARQALEAVGLDANLDSYPNSLSGGMKRRVALARAFVHQPDLLLMDEPFVSLDHPNAEKMRQLVLELWQQRRPAVLFVTHNLEEAITLADRLIFLSTDPASVILDIQVTIERPRNEKFQALADYRQALFERYPQILTGRAPT